MNLLENLLNDALGTRLKTYKFTAYGKTFSAKAERGVDVMGQANRALVWNAEAKEGCWMERSDTEYAWVEGNFFD